MQVFIIPRRCVAWILSLCIGWITLCALWNVCFLCLCQINWNLTECVGIWNKNDSLMGELLVENVKCSLMCFLSMFGSVWLSPQIFEFHFNCYKSIFVFTSTISCGWRTITESKKSSILSSHKAPWLHRPSQISHDRRL
jgi:hypothetical protein